VKEAYGVHIDKEHFPWQTKVHVRRANGSGNFSYCSGIENGHLFFTDYKPGEVIPPLFSTDSNSEGYGLLQALATELTRLGIKPEELQPVERELVAVKDHLKDMRAITFKQFSMEDQE